jgi:hypothetical protein
LLIHVSYRTADGYVRVRGIDLTALDEVANQILGAAEF